MTRIINSNLCLHKIRRCEHISFGCVTLSCFDLLLEIILFLETLIGYLNCLWWIRFQLSWEAWLLSPLKIINRNMECFALDLEIANSSGFCFGSSVYSITMPQKTFQLTLFSYYAFFMAWKADTWYWFGCIYFGMLHDIHKVRIFIHLKFWQRKKTSLSIFICLWILMEKKKEYSKRNHRVILL